MKGDFTRLGFAAGKSYTQVLKQQGRVDLDADWNEQGAIIDFLRRVGLQDIIGLAGIPRDTGFELALSGDGSEVAAGPGRIYVDGILCEVEEISTDTIRDGSEVVGQRDLVILDVWERHVTALEDPEIREVALGGPDTTTRLQTVTQLRVLKDAGADCDSDEDVWKPTPSGGRLTTGVELGAAPANPCDLPAQGGYRGLENRLYRVEIHEGGALGTATWKWSRDNGAVVFAIEEFPASLPDRVRVRRLGRDQVLTLQVGDWVEILDDAAELAGAPGFMARVEEVDDGTRLVALDRAIPNGAFDPALHPRIRRWDQQADTESDGLVATGVGPIELEDGIEVSFGGDDFRVGDYWMFAARTVTRDVEPLDDAEPQGIAHHYARLATIFWEDGGEEAPVARLERCKLEFPPLTDITADDVSYDDGNCDLTGAETVQEAIDRLCQARDLRHHNKHLHGWGIVCGLQVHCGADVASDERRSVTVRSGYAIDCEGNDILLDENASLDVLTAIANLNQENPNDPVLNENGDGEVCLKLDRDVEAGRRFTFERYTPEQKGIQDLLRGTLLIDFYNHCIRNVVDFIRDEFTEDDGEEQMLVGPTRKRLTTLLNVLVQLWNPTNGRYVYLSRREHDILRSFYDGLRGILQSRTFCAMFEGARQFPDYPFDDDQHTTIFGKDNHSRLRVDPRTGRAYTMGVGNRIHAFDLEKGEMIAEIEFPGGEGAIVRDVAFPAGGTELYAVATVNNSSLFAIADVSGADYKWRPVSINCDLLLVTLATFGEDRQRVYAIGKGTGLHSFDPTAPQVRPEVVATFNAVGHLEIHPTGVAFATGSTGDGTTDRYNAFVRVPLAATAPNPQTVPLMRPEGLPMSGDDDIAIDEGTNRLAVVVDGPNGGTKEILFFDTNGATAPRQITTDLENTAIRLGYARNTGTMLVSYEDSFRLDLLDQNGRPVSGYRHPVQISPMGIEMSGDGETAYVLNQVSNTIGAIPARYLTATGRIDVDALAEYRTGVVEAFIDLFGGFLQYLKDCFCDHLLVNCPDCEDEDDIYLACVSVRGGEVYRVCNFSRRKYVKSFPTIGYWMSMVPIWPMMKQVVERICCSLPMLFFGQRAAPQSVTFEKQASGARMRQGMALLQQTDFRGATRAVSDRVSIAKTLTSDWVGTRPVTTGPTSVKGQVAGINQAEIVNQPVETAQSRLAAQNVTVTEVKEYDPAAGARNLLQIGTAPTKLRAGQEIELYQQDGQVKYYAIVSRSGSRTAGGSALEGDRAAELDGQIRSLRTELTELKTSATAVETGTGLTPAVDAEIQSLRAELADVRANAGTTTAGTGVQPVAEIEAELKTLREEVSTLRESQGTGAVVAPNTELESELKSLRDEIGELRTRAESSGSTQPTTEVTSELSSLREEIAGMRQLLTSRDQQIAELSSRSTELQNNLRQVTDLQARISRLERPQG